MKRNIKFVIVLAIVLVVALGSFLVVNKIFLTDEQKSAKEAAELQISSFDSDSITKISITDTDNTEYVFEVKDGEWTYDGDDDFRLNTYYCASVCSYLSDLSATKNVGVVDESSKTAYGLSNPLTITVSDGESSYTVYVGKATSTSEGWYIQGDKNDNVYTIDYTIGLFLSDVKDNMKNAYFTYGWGEMDFNYYKITKNGEVITELIKDENSKWYEYQPIQHAIDSTELINLLVNISRYEVVSFGADDVFTEEDYAEYGFDNPCYTFEVKNKDGDEIKMLIADDLSDLSSDEEVAVPVLYTNSGQITYISSTSLSFLECNTYYYTNTKIFSIDKADVTSVTVDLEDKYDCDFTINCSYDSEEYEYTEAEINGVKLDLEDSDISSAFDDLMDSILKIELSEVDANATVEGEATNSISLTYNDDDLVCNVTYSFIPQSDNDNKFYIKEDDEYTGVIARRNSFSDDSSIVGLYTELKELIG